MSKTIQVDSLIANEFAFEIEGERISGVFRISNLTPFASDLDGNRIKPPFEIAKMVQRDKNNPFNMWLRETLENRESGNLPTRQITVLAVDDGIETRHWKIENARITGVRYSEFDSGSFEMIAEIYSISYDEIHDHFVLD